MRSIEDFLENDLQLTLVRDGPNVRCCCPFHGENDPSFVIYASGDGHAHCYGGCPRGRNTWRDIVDLVADLYYRQRPKKERLAKAFALCRARGWLEAERKLATMTQVHTESSTPPAGLRHRLAMTIAFRHWHNAFMDHQLGMAARHYLFDVRGIRGPCLNQVIQTVGFAPSGYATFDAIVEEVGTVLGTQATQTLVECGIATRSGKPRLSRHLIFACYDTSRPAEEQVVYYQARVLGTPATGPRFLNPPLRRAAYWPFALARPMYSGTHLLEGPTDALAIAAQGWRTAGIFCGACPEESDPFWQSVDHSEPLWVWGDNEVEEKPGPQLNRDCLALGARMGWDHRIPQRPADLKDPALWLESVGPVAFGAALEATCLVRVTEVAPPLLASPPPLAPPVAAKPLRSLRPLVARVSA